MNTNLEGLFSRTLDDRLPRHEVECNLNFLRYVGGTINDDRLELWIGERDRDLARSALASRGVKGGDLLIAIAPGAGHPKRLWPLGCFIEVGRFLLRQFDCVLLLIGGAEDGDRIYQLKTELGRRAFAFSGETTLRQTCAVLEHVQLAIANDSGPMHLAAAAGAAVIEISCHPADGDPNHDNSPMRFRPWTTDYAVAQPTKSSPPCKSACEWHEPHCILQVSVQSVLEMSNSLLRKRLELSAGRPEISSEDSSQTSLKSKGLL
jgi:heptosyltransferase-2